MEIPQVLSHNSYMHSGAFCIHGQADKLTPALKHAKPLTTQTCSRPLRAWLAYLIPGQTM